MKFTWFKPRPIPRRFIIPEDKVKQFWALYDVGGKSGKFALWSFIAEMFPETKVGDWSIRTGDIFNPVIVEDIDEGWL